MFSNQKVEPFSAHVNSHMAVFTVQNFIIYKNEFGAIWADNSPCEALGRYDICNMDEALNRLYGSRKISIPS